MWREEKTLMFSSKSCVFSCNEALSLFYLSSCGLLIMFGFITVFVVPKCCATSDAMLVTKLVIIKKLAMHFRIRKHWPRSRRTNWLRPRILHVYEKMIQIIAKGSYLLQGQGAELTGHLRQRRRSLPPTNKIQRGRDEIRSLSTLQNHERHPQSFAPTKIDKWPVDGLVRHGRGISIRETQSDARQVLPEFYT